MKNIILTGGNSLFPNYRTRIHSEVFQYIPDQWTNDVKVSRQLPLFLSSPSPSPFRSFSQLTPSTTPGTVPLDLFEMSLLQEPFRGTLSLDKSIKREVTASAFRNSIRSSFLLATGRCLESPISIVIYSAFRRPLCGGTMREVRKGIRY